MGPGPGSARRGPRPGRPVRAVPVPMSSLRSPAQLREGAGAASLARAVARAVLGSVRGSARRGPQWWRPRGRLCPREPGAHPGCVRVRPARRLWGRLAAGRRPHGSRPVCQSRLAQPGGGTHASREQRRRRLAAASAPRGAKVTGPRSGGTRCRRPAQLRRALRQRRWTAGRPGTLCPRWTPWPSGRRLRWPALPRR